jgi:hypothetical protein
VEDVMMTDNNEIDALLKDVVRENGRPVVISPYGFKVGEIEGKKYMIAMSKEENDEFRKENEIEPTRGYCSIDDYARCYRTDCSGSCSLTTSGGRWVCICSN